MPTKNKRLTTIFLAVVLILLIPLIAMQFTDEVNWNLGDFVVMGFLLSVTGIAIDFVIRKIKNSNYRIAIALAILISFILIWAELGVGIFGTPFAGS
jgi:hypothetical protein